MPPQELTALLRHFNMNRAGFAALCGVSTMAVSRWMRGRLPAWPVRLLLADRKLIDLIDTGVADLPLPWQVVLGVPRDCDSAIARQAYRSLSMRHHTDHCNGDDTAMKKLTRAWIEAKAHYKKLGITHL